MQAKEVLMFPAMSRCPEPFVRQLLSGLEDHLEREGQSTEHLEILRRIIWGQRLSALALGVWVLKEQKWKSLKILNHCLKYLAVFSISHQ